MALLDILLYPDARLRRTAHPVAVVDESVRRLVDDMAETMYAAPGIGLAAVQVDRNERIVVIDASQDRSCLNIFINPTITDRGGELECEEGCLSLPGVYAPVTRSQRVQVQALNRDGEAFALEAEDLLAVCIQHEIDHLDGVVFVDYLSRLKHDRIRKRLEKESRHNLSTQPDHAALVL